MKKYFNSLLRLNNQKGVTALLVTLIMVILLSIIALAIDYGYGVVTRNELQNVADASALAATRMLGEIYEGMSYEDQQKYVCDPATIKDIFFIDQDNKYKALGNRAGGEKIELKDADIVIGQWNGETKTFTPTLNQPDAVRVTARRDAVANNPITTFFARIFGKILSLYQHMHSSFNRQSNVEPGKLTPVGISEAWFNNKEIFCDQDIKFYPTNTEEGCAGWNTYKRFPASESYLRKDILEPWLNDPAHPPSPSASIGDEFYFTGAIWAITHSRHF